MVRKKESYNRRSLLKTVAAAGIVGTGLTASTGIGSAADDQYTACNFLTVDGKSDHTDYTIELHEDWNGGNEIRGAMGTSIQTTDDGNPETPPREQTEIVTKSYTEDSDNINGTTITGEVYGGYIDRYNSDDDLHLSTVSVDGGEVAIYIGSYGFDACYENTISYGKGMENIEIDISGDGTYTIGFWKADDDFADLSGKNLEGSEIETCFPRGSPNRKKIEVVCVSKDPGEGVHTREVEISDHTGDYSGEYQFGTGEVHGYQYKDSFEVADGPPNTGRNGPKYLHLKGDLTVNITYNED